MDYQLIKTHINGRIEVIKSFKEKDLYRILKNKKRNEKVIANTSQKGVKKHNINIDNAKTVYKSHSGKTKEDQSGWNWSNLPGEIRGKIESFVNKGNHIELDKIRKIYNLSDDCPNCNKSKKKWLINSFSIALELNLF